MPYFAVNIPGPSLVRKTPEVRWPAYADDYPMPRIRREVTARDSRSSNVTWDDPDGILWLLSRSVIVQAESSDEALSKCAGFTPPREFFRIPKHHHAEEH